MPRDPHKPWRQWPSDAPVAQDPNVCTPQELLFVESYVRYTNLAKAARAAGFCGPTVGQTALQQAGLRCLKKPRVALLIQKHRDDLYKRTHYAATDAMKEAEEAMQFAKSTDNANALVKAIELRSKLHGLIIEKSDMRLIGGFTIAISGIDDPKPQLAFPAGVVPNLINSPPALPPPKEVDPVPVAYDGPKSVLDDIEEAESQIPTTTVEEVDPFADGLPPSIDPFADA